MSLHLRIALYTSLAAFVAVLIVALLVIYCPAIAALPQPLLVLCALLFVPLVAGSTAAIATYRSFKPVKDIINTLHNINENQLYTRLNNRRHDDILADLITEINELLQRIDDSFDSQKMFVSNVSHELRTPLAALIGGLDLAQQKERSKKEYQSVIDDALADAQRMNRLIDGLLNLAKASYNKDQITKQKIRLDELLLDARNALLKAHSKYNVEILFETDTYDDEQCVTVMGNEYLLNIAFTNLMENNCKYSDDHSSFVQISYWDRLTIVRLSDSGVGMTPIDKEHLFKLFYRGEQTAKIEGHGIGMALAQRIITLHDGTISVYSEEGKGTTFVIELPHI